MEGETNGHRTEQRETWEDWEKKTEREEKNKHGEIVGWAKRCNVHTREGETMDMDSEAERDGWFHGLGK